MGKRWTRPLLLAALWWGTAQAFAANAVVVPTAESGLEQVQAQKAAAYASVLAQFDRAIAAAPDDASMGVARCEYINRFTDDEAGEWIASASDEFEKCREWVGKRWPGAPAVQLFQLEQSWDEEAIAFGEKLGKAIDAWPTPLRRRAFSHLAFAYDDSDEERSGEFAVKAANLGDGDMVQKAVEHLIAKKDFNAATKLVEAGPLATLSWRANGTVAAALSLPDKQIAKRALQRYDDGKIEIPPYTAARALSRAGDVDGARKRIKGHAPQTNDDRATAFDLAIAAHDVPAALDYVSFEKMDDFSGTMQRAAVLATTAPASLASIPMFVALFMFMLVLAAMTLFAGALLVPAHYRGLARRVRHLRTMPLFEHINLWHAWYAAAVAICVPTVAIFVLAPNSLGAMLGDEGKPPPLVFDAMLWGTVAGLLCFAPVVRRIPWRQLVGDRATWRAWWRVPVAWAALWIVGISVSLLNQWTGGGAETAHTRLIESMAGEGVAVFGGLGTLLLMALLVPIFEELTFRGLLLGGLTRHISFGWANTAQALVFAVIHDDPPRFIFYFAMGLFCGWLVKSTKSLGPAIALHMLNNAFAASILMLR